MPTVWASRHDDVCPPVGGLGAGGAWYYSNSAPDQGPACLATGGQPPALHRLPVQPGRHQQAK